MYTSILNHEKPTVERQFKESVGSALVRVISSEENSPLMEEFQLAHQHRSRFPWLLESGKLPGEAKKAGAVGAFCEALASYVPMPQRREEGVTRSLRQPLLAETKEELTKAAAVAAEDDVSLWRFINGIARVSLDHKDADVDQLVPHIQAALAQYCEFRTSGTSPDPW
ncbi:hypothetical protein ACFWZR_28465 [Streptomyces sp. NPDC059017]|uniref:hypothetical protein n=1 Tax=Streptomyces sp. NPDC059017 TaxID=3346700 RepID=UPI0036CF105E